MPLTADQHRQIGRILGIPECCIEAFVTKTQVRASGVQRGPCRTREECEEADRAIRPIVGDPRWTTMDDPRRVHAPCVECYQAVLGGGHPDGWVFDDEHHLLCDIDHTHANPLVIQWIESLPRERTLAL